VTERYYTTSSAFLEALAEAGISYIFANLGSDHPGLIEALAQAKADGRADELPKLIICPHETVALSAAHAYAMVTGQPQAVVVHVDSGTQNIGAMVNNAMRGRAPVLVFAGTVPYTQDGELPGSRTEFIQWIQDVRDQRGILRNYVNPTSRGSPRSTGPPPAPRSTTSTSTRSSPRCSSGRCPPAGSPAPTRRSRWSRSPPTSGSMTWSRPGSWRSAAPLPRLGTSASSTGGRRPSSRGTT
jgi:hypothetical protein